MQHFMFDIIVATLYGKCNQYSLKNVLLIEFSYSVSSHMRQLLMNRDLKRHVKKKNVKCNFNDAKFIYSEITLIAPYTEKYAM